MNANIKSKALRKLHDGTVIPATPLALTSDKRFDERRQRLLMRYYLNAGAGGIATGVHSTQFEIHDQKYELLEPVYETVADEIKKFERASGKTIVKIAGACGPVKDAVREAELAVRLGYDAVLLSPGGLRELDEDEILKRTEAVAEIIPVIGFALQPAAGGRIFSYRYWSRLCEIKNVAAIKAAPFNRYQTLDIARAVAFSPRREEIALYTGNDDNIGADLMTVFKFKKDGEDIITSFAGGLLGHYSYWTKIAVELFERFTSARDSGAVSSELLSVSAMVTDMNCAVFDARNNFKGCISGMHEVLRRQGLLEGVWCLNEDERMSDGQAEEIGRVVSMYPELTDDEYVASNIAHWSEGL